MTKRISLKDEDSRLVSLAIAMSRRDCPVEIPIGVPSPDDAGTPGTYFGAIAMLKYLVMRGVLTPEKVHELIKQDNIVDYSNRGK